MDQNTLKRLMQEYDFMKNSKVSFSKKYGVSIRTVHSYIRMLGLKHKANRMGVIIPKDSNGRYTSPQSVQPQQDQPFNIYKFLKNSDTSS